MTLTKSVEANMVSSYASTQFPKFALQVLANSAPEKAKSNAVLSAVTPRHSMKICDGGHT